MRIGLTKKLGHAGHLLQGSPLISVVFQFTQQDFGDVCYACHRRIFGIVCVPAESIDSCRGHDIGQHVEVTEPVDDSCLIPVLPRAGSGGSKAMYSNDTGRHISAI